MGALFGVVIPTPSEQLLQTLRSALLTRALLCTLSCRRRTVEELQNALEMGSGNLDATIAMLYEFDEEDGPRLTVCGTVAACSTETRHLMQKRTINNQDMASQRSLQQNTFLLGSIGQSTPEAAVLHTHRTHGGALTVAGGGNGQMASGSGVLHDSDGETRAWRLALGWCANSNGRE